MTAEPGSEFDRPMTLVEARRWRERIESGARHVPEPRRADVLAWLTDEIARLDTIAPASSDA